MKQDLVTILNKPCDGPAFEGGSAICYGRVGDWTITQDNHESWTGTSMNFTVTTDWDFYANWKKSDSYGYYGPLGADSQMPETHKLHGEVVFYDSPTSDNDLKR